MKKLLALLAIVPAGIGAVVLLRDRAEAMPPPPLGVVRVECNGNIQCCSGTGPRQFTYEVRVPSGNSVTSIEVGTHDSNVADYVNLIMPANWNLSIVNGGLTDSGFNCTPHGSVSPVGGACPSKLVFSGPARTANFRLAYDFVHNWDIHQTEWKASNGRKAISFPVGNGNGPVHSPMIP